MCEFSQIIKIDIMYSSLMPERNGEISGEMVLICAKILYLLIIYTQNQNSLSNKGTNKKGKIVAWKQKQYKLILCLHENGSLKPHKIK